MGIPVDYKDADYFGNLPTSPPVSMMPLSKEQLASKECFEEQKNSHILTKVRLTKLDQQNQESAQSVDRLAKELSLDVEVHLLTKGLELRAPIKMVDGCLWSPGVYQTLCLLGKTLEVAWERAFIQTSHFKIIISYYQVIFRHFSVTASKLVEELLHPQVRP
jgi:hypothetical protein